MKKEIIAIMIKHGDAYWDNDSETKSPDLSDAETEAINKCNSNCADEILELIKNNK